MSKKVCKFSHSFFSTGGYSYAKNFVLFLLPFIYLVVPYPKNHSIHEPEVQCISKGKERKKYRLFCKRAGIEPPIGHLKSDHRLGRNFYKRLAGDAVNILLVVATYSFKRAMRALLELIK